MVKQGDIFWLKNPYELKTASIPHMHLTVSSTRNKKEMLIGTSQLQYAVMNKLAYKKVTEKPVTKPTYFLTSRVYSIEDVEVQICSFANPLQLPNLTTSSILRSVRTTESILLDTLNSLTLNPRYLKNI